MQKKDISENDPIKVFYRISDKGTTEGTLPYASKFQCLENAIKEFGADFIFVIADNCSPQTVEFIKSKKLAFEETSLGNLDSFQYMIKEKILQEDDNTLVYLLEDDYLHRPGSKKIMLEGLSIADYVSLYDHPDQYFLHNNHGTILNFRKIRPCRLMFTKSSHWRVAGSTPMTFACRVGTLREDCPVFFKYRSKSKKRPKSFYVFTHLTRLRKINPLYYFLTKGSKNLLFIVLANYFRSKKRILVTSVPGYSSHCHENLESPVIDWSAIPD